MMLKNNRLLEFGPFRADLDARVLMREADLITLPPKAFDVLEALLRSAGRVLTRDELMTAVWGEVDVEEGNLTQAISILRKALGDSSQEPQYIVTIPRRGYRFGVSVYEVPNAEPAVVQPDATADSDTNEPAVVSKRSRKPLVLTVAALLLLTAAAGFRVFVQPQRTAPSGIQSVAVLPFVNLSAGSEQEYFCDGLTEEIINAVAAIPEIKVVARTSAFQFKGKNVDIRTIGKTLGVDSVLEGSIRRDGTRVRITAQLNSARDGYHFWSRTWDRTLGDVFAVERDIASEVAAAVGKPGGIAARELKPLTRSWEAHDLYLQGHLFKSRILEGMLPRAVEAFERALAVDPAFAAAPAQIGQAYIWALQLGKAPAAEVFPIVRRRAQQALALDPNLALAHALLADVSFLGDWDFPAAERSFRRAIDLNPGDTDTRHEFTHYLLAMGRFQEAEAEALKITELDPVSMDALTHLQLHYLMARDIPRALAAAERSMALGSSRSDALRFLQWTHEAAGQYGKAIETAAKRTDIKREVIAALEAGLKSRGEIGYWTAWHEALLREPADAGSRAWEMAGFYARTGERKKALTWLAKAIDLRHGVYLKVAREFDGLRDEPEFQNLVRRVGLPLP